MTPPGPHGRRCQCLCECGQRTNDLHPLRLEIGVTWCTLEVCGTCHAEAMALEKAGLFGRPGRRVA
jgi:hypothetical protein